MIIDNEQVYINLETKYSVDLNTHVFVKDVGQVYCTNIAIKKRVEDTRIYNGQDKEMFDYLTGNDVITKVLDSINNIDISLTGGPDVLIEIKEREAEKAILKFLKIVVVMVVLFFGAAAAIINFYEDVNMAKSLERVYFLVTGVKKENPLILTVSLSIGIGFGMFAFFSRIFSLSKRRRQEPGPMELELYLYDKDIEDNVLDELKTK